MACEYLPVEVMERWIISKSCGTRWEEIEQHVTWRASSEIFLCTVLPICSWVSSLSWMPQLQQPVPEAMEAVPARLPVHHPHPGGCAAGAQGH